MGVHLLKRQQSSASMGGGGGGSSGSWTSMPPKGCMAVRVVGPAGGGGDCGVGGRGEEEEGEKFVVPVGWLKHPLFVGLLKEAEEEYGFEQKGAITIPCGVDHFRRVQCIIHHQKNHHGSSHGLLSGNGNAGHGHGHGSSGHHNFHIAACFRA